jgi:hypothetical protein
MHRSEYPRRVSRPVALAACLSALAVFAPVGSAGATERYATASGAVRKAIRDGVRTRLLGARIVELKAGCSATLAVGERADCEGGFRVRRGRRSAIYLLTPRSRAQRISPGAIQARADARRYRRYRGFPPRIDMVAVLDGPVPPAERIVHGAVVLEDSVRPSRTLWLAFPVPFGWWQAYGEGPVRLPGTVERLYGKRPGGVCTVRLHLYGRLTATPPPERDGRLFTHPDDTKGMPVLSRSADGAGTTTWLGTARGVRAGPAPPGLGPPQLATLVVVGDVSEEVVRYGTPGRDGIPLLEPTRAQEVACTQAAAETARLHLPRALARAQAARRP